VLSKGRPRRRREAFRVFPRPRHEAVSYSCHRSLWYRKLQRVPARAR
jgi:hypothetical protein